MHSILKLDMVHYMPAQSNVLKYDYSLSISSIYDESLRDEGD